MAEHFEPMELVGTEDCALCRGRFPQRITRGPDAWQSHFRAILCLDSKNESDVEVTEPAILPDFGLDIDITLNDRPRDQIVTVCRDPPDIWKDRIEKNPFCLAFCVHSWCFSVLMWKVPECPASTVYKLVRSLIPKPSFWENSRGDVAGDCCPLDEFGSLQTLAACTDCLPAELSLPSMSKVPLEIRSYIWEYVGCLSPYSAFTIVAGEASRLIGHLHPPRSREVLLKRGSRFSAKVITVFGTDYLQDLICGEGSELNCQVLGTVTGVKFVASLGGICAIKFIGCEWETDWIGKIPRTGAAWYGAIQGMIRALHFSYNDLNCAVDISSSEPCSPTLIMWDQQNFPSIVDPEIGLFDHYRDIAGSRSPVSKTPKRRFFRYLPLYTGDEYINGLTVYIRIGTIVGLEAHFRRTSRLSGFRIGCPIYFPLQLNERIAYVWVCIYDTESLAFNQRSLVIQTTFGRRYSFGPYILPHQVLQDEYKWILLKSSGCVSGFYYENSGWPTSVTSLGIANDSLSPMSSPLTPQYRDSPGWPPIATPTCLFLSFAVLSGLKTVHLCRVGNRCTGMLMHYATGPTVVLGQWHSPSVSEQSCIYNGDGPTITNIYFRTLKSQGHQIVTDIGFSTDWDEAVRDSNFRVFNIQTHIAWWFSEFHDEILPWIGMLRDIPGRSKTSQDLFRGGNN